MAPDEFKNLGFAEDKPSPKPTDEGKKGELRW